MSGKVVKPSGYPSRNSVLGALMQRTSTVRNLNAHHRADVRVLLRDAYDAGLARGRHEAAEVQS